MNEKYFVNQVGGVHGPELPTPLARAAFVYLDKRNDKFTNERTGRGKYGVTLLFDKDSETGLVQLKEIQKAAKDMSEFYCQKEWGKTDKKVPYAKFKAAVEAKFQGQPIFRDGDMAKYEGFSGNWYIVAKNDENNGSRGIMFLGDARPEEYEAGQLVRAQVQLYLDQKGFSYRLTRIKLVKDDGFRFATSVKSEDLISALDEAVEAVKTPIERTNGSAKVASEDSLMDSFDKATEGDPLDVLG